jgi:hypothetical protein
MDRSAGNGPSPLVLCLHGSPRAGGNTDLLLEAVASGAQQEGAAVEHLYCRKLRIRGCTGCGACEATGLCAVSDDMERVYPCVDAANALVVGAPVYFLGVPAQLKAVIDRFQCRWSRLHVLGRALPPPRPGAFVAAAGAPSPKVFACSRLTVDALFEVIGVERRWELVCEHADARGAVAQRPDVLEQARQLGRRLAAAAAAPAITRDRLPET